MNRLANLEYPLMPCSERDVENKVPVIQRNSHISYAVELHELKLAREALISNLKLIHEAGSMKLSELTDEISLLVSEKPSEIKRQS